MSAGLDSFTFIIHPSANALLFTCERKKRERERERRWG